jgi:general secretion pathway protein B
MSFILDALKKSESDRQRQSGPSLFEVKVAPPRRRLPIWAMAIAVLLGINAVVVSWMLLRHGPTQQPAATGASGSAAATAPGTTPTPPPVATAARAASPATSGGRMPAPAGGAPSGAGSPAAAATAPAAAAAVRSPAVSAAAGSGGSNGPSSAATLPAAAPSGSGADGDGGQASSGGSPSDYAPAVEPAAASAGGTSASASGTADGLPLYQQIVTSDGLPPLHLDLHVFAKSPKDRFVMINMQRLGEGDSLPNGVQVDAIRPDGVVLSYHGTRFLLPRD